MTVAAAREETQVGASVPAPLAPELRVGSTLGAYRIEELVGRGGMGAVYRAQHIHLGRPAALKLLLPELADDRGFRERFLRESRVAASITHPNVIPVYDAGEAEGLLYIAMKYVDGTDLGALLREERSLAPERALFLLGQVADALDAAHELGIVHRDIKPGNVLIEGDRCYLTDFGLTRRISSQTQLTAKGQFVGTLDYTAPEQIRGGSVDARTDVYALGCLLYHALSGSVPYDKDSEVSVVYAHLEEPPPVLSRAQASLPGEIDAVIGKALAKRREDRFDRCADLVTAARAALSLGPPTAFPPPPARPRTKVLVADPSASVRALVAVSLGTERFELLQAEDPESALALAREERPRLVLADRQTAAELVAVLRDDLAAADMRLVAMTARSDGVDGEDVLATGADGYLRKPFSSLQLLAEVGALLGPEAKAE
jgi:serine/threonine protein kinase